MCNYSLKLLEFSVTCQSVRDIKEFVQRVLSVLLYIVLYKFDFPLRDGFIGIY